MFHNHSREDTLGPKWPLQQPNSTDSLFHPDICLSSNKRLHREPQFPVAGKKSPKKVIGSQRETPRRSVLDTSAIDEKGSYYLSKRYGPEIEKEDYKMRTRGKSLSLLDSESAKKKEKREKEESSQPKSKYKLQVKIEGLKSLIKTEKEMMLGLKKKISSEKSELSLLQQKLDAKKSKSKSKKKTKELRLNKSAMALVHDIEDLDESVASKRPPVVSEKILQKRSSAAFQEEKSFDKSVSIRTRDSPYRNSRLSIGRSDKENYDLEKRTRNKGSQAYEAKMSVLEDSIKQLKSKYEEEITGLRGRLEEMRNENLKLKETTTYEKGYERIQILQSKRLQDLTETLGKKERELIVQERYYKEQIDTMARKVIMLNDEMEKAMQKQEKIKELKSQIQSKNTDIEITKQYFVEKLKSNLEDHYNQKKEWSNVQNDLARELQSLKVKENVTPPFPTVSYVTEHKYKGKGSRI